MTLLHKLWAKSCQHRLWTPPMVLSATSCRVGKMWELPTCILIFIAAFLSVCPYGCLLDGNKKVFTMYRVGSKSFVGLYRQPCTMLPWFMQRPLLNFINKSWYVYVINPVQCTWIKIDLLWTYDKVIYPKYYKYLKESCFFL